MTFELPEEFTTLETDGAQLYHSGQFLEQTALLCGVGMSLEPLHGIFSDLTVFNLQHSVNSLSYSLLCSFSQGSQPPTIPVVNLDHKTQPMN